MDPDRGQTLGAQLRKVCLGVLPIKQGDKIVVGNPHAFEALAPFDQLCQCNVGSARVQLVEHVVSLEACLPKLRPTNTARLDGVG